jgi:hypothetical protein
MRRPLPLLDGIRIPVRCAVPWEAMSGDDRTRNCPSCAQAVYNLSSMSRAEAAAFVAAHEGDACVRFYRRPDGTVATRDLRAGTAAGGGRSLRRAAVALLSWVSLSLLGGCESRCYQGKPSFRGSGPPASHKDIQPGNAPPGGDARQGGE